MQVREEREIVAAAQAGSEAAFALLVTTHRQSIVHLAYRLTKDRQQAEDIAQESFFRAYASLDTFVPERRFNSWLFTIARNASITELRKKPTAARALLTDVIASEPGPEELALRGDEAARLHRALSSLPEIYRTVLELYYFRGLLYREIAERLSMPIGTVKTRIARAKRALRDECDSLALQRNSLPTA